DSDSAATVRRCPRGGIDQSRDGILIPWEQTGRVQPSIVDAPWIRHDRAGRRHVNNFRCDRRKGAEEVLRRFRNQHALGGWIDVEIAEDRGRKTLAAVAAHNDVNAAAAKGGNIASEEL